MAKRIGTLFLLLGAATIMACSSAPKAQPADQGTGSAAAAPSKAPSIQAKGRVAIFAFEVKGGGPSLASLGGDIPESLSEAFIKGGRLRPVERRDLEKALAEQELALSGLVDEATAARVGALAGAKYALLGSASVIETQIRVSCRLIDIETGEIVYAQSARGETKDVYGVLEKLATAVEDGFSK